MLSNYHLPVSTPIIKPSVNIFSQQSNYLPLFSPLNFQNISLLKQSKYVNNFAPNFINNLNNFNIPELFNVNNQNKNNNFKNENAIPSSVLNVIIFKKK